MSVICLEEPYAEFRVQHELQVKVQLRVSNPACRVGKAVATGGRVATGDDAGVDVDANAMACGRALFELCRWIPTTTSPACETWPDKICSNSSTGANHTSLHMGCISLEWALLKKNSNPGNSWIGIWPQV
ncbi:hypothetical protein PRUPE_5G047400 [Prunus persica]|uniref:Uncharacterized protein n=1 Tax=Prunus persica TaxID=3760 RepID=M5WCE3_PRUPE|nr:hypothetical protein PRUPE_5G047400 [Prunus persica]